MLIYIYYPKQNEVNKMLYNGGCNLVNSKIGKRATWIHQLPKITVTHHRLLVKPSEDVDSTNQEPFSGC